jgi:hypothetical protein
MKTVPRKWFSNPTENESIAGITRKERNKNCSLRKKGRTAMKTVYICSRYRADKNHTVEDTVSSVLSLADVRWIRAVLSRVLTHIFRIAFRFQHYRNTERIKRRFNNVTDKFLEKF